MQVWKHLFQQANYLNYKDKGVMAGKRNYSSHKYILWKLDLNFLALNVWIRDSSSSVDAETKTCLYKKNQFIMQECISYKIHVDPMDFAFRKAK